MLFATLVDTLARLAETLEFEMSQVFAKMLDVALRSQDWFLDPHPRLSHTQAQWTTEGVAAYREAVQ